MLSWKTKLKQAWFKCKRIIAKQKRAFDSKIAPLKKLDYWRGFNSVTTLAGIAINTAVYTGIVWMWNHIGLSVFGHPLTAHFFAPIMAGLAVPLTIGAGLFTAGLVFATATKTLGNGDTRFKQVLGLLNSALPFGPFIMFPFAYGVMGVGQSVAMGLALTSAVATALWVTVASDINRLSLAFAPTIAPAVPHKPAKRAPANNKKRPKPTSNTKPAILNQYKNKNKKPALKKPAPKKAKKALPKKKARR